MKKRMGFLVFLIVLVVINAVGLTACGGKEFTVTFEGNGGTLVSGQEVQNVKKGESATPPIYEKEGYTLSWEGSYENITSNTTVTALWTLKQYTYTFYDEDGATVLKTETLDYGSAITAPATPSKEATAQYTYAFDSWDKVIPTTLTANITFTASYSYTVNKYTYIFYDEDGATVLETETLDYGSAITPPAAPEKASTAEYTFTFDSWDKEIPSSLIENITFTARYTQEDRVYTVTFDSNGGSAVTQKTALYNNAISAPADPEKASYTFAGWYTNSDCTEEYNFTTPLTADITLFAKWEEGSKGLVYTLINDDTEYSVTGYADYYDMEVHIPALYKGKPVTSIGAKAFYGYWPLTGVTIPQSVKSIGSEAFYGCQKITSIVIPQGVTSIGNGAFDSAGLTSVTLPEGLKSIGNSAFKNCTGLISVVIPDSVTSLGESAFYWCTQLSSATLSAQLTAIEKQTFYHCINLTSIVIPQGVTSIGESAFSMCSSLSDITFSAQLSSIDDWAFYYCGSLVNVVIPSGVTCIGERAFWDCSELISVTVLALTPPAVGYEVFADTHESMLICVPSLSLAAYKEAEDWSDYATKIIPITVSATFDSKGGNAVSSQTVPYKTVISLPDEPTKEGYTFIGWYTNSACTEEYDFDTLLTADITLYAKWKEVGTEGLTYALTDDDEYEVTGYNGLDTEVYIPSVYNGKPVTGIGDYAFLFSGLISVEIPKSVTSIGLEVFSHCPALALIGVDAANAFYKSVDGVLFNKAGTVLICYPAAKAGVSYSLPLGVTSIGDSAFSMCENLIGITIPSGVISIGSYAFSGCTSLTSIEIPSSVTGIGMGAFSGCSAVKSVTVFALTPPELGEDAFSYMHDSLLIYVPSSSLAAYKEAEDWSDYATKIIPITVTATFDSKGGNAVSSQTVPYKTVISLPDEPTKEGYTFIGWYRDSDCTEEYDFDTLLTADITLYAKWEEGSRGLVFALSSDGLSYAISGYEGEDLNVVIPNYYQSKPITVIRIFAFSGKNIVSVHIGSNIEIISDQSFIYCVSLERVTFGADSALEKIEDSAFEYCTLLSDITLPKNLKSIAWRAFCNTHSLTRIVLPPSVTIIENYAFEFSPGNESNLTIYCEAEEKPEGWGDSWSICSFPARHTVVWGYIDLED